VAIFPLMAEPGIGFQHFGGNRIVEVWGRPGSMGTVAQCGQQDNWTVLLLLCLLGSTLPFAVV